MVVVLIGGAGAGIDVEGLVVGGGVGEGGVVGFDMAYVFVISPAVWSIQMILCRPCTRRDDL